MMAAIYDFYKGYCVCPGKDVYLGMRDLNGFEADSFPVTVYNVNEVAIGLAHNKEEYIRIWNSDAADQAIGTLSGLIGPFSFTLTLNPGKTAPPYVIGDVNGAIVGNGIIDIGNNFLIDAFGNFITSISTSEFETLEFEISDFNT